MTTVSRLIESFVPTHYNLDLTLKRQERTFHGTVIITGVLEKAETPIMVHAKDLTIHAATIDGAAATYSQGDQDELSITIDNLPSGEHAVTIEFSGTITDHMHGLYPCYFEHEGIKKELLATQFESHHAREVFPCIDEPAAKATFDLQLTTEKGVTVLSNMPVASQAITNDLQTTAFETTPRMSTYLLAFVVGELQKKTGKTKGGVEVNIYATHAQPVDSLDFSLSVATNVIDFYNEFFGTPYPLPKSDHVALPDFTVGAMENWGLITYRETTLLADPDITSISSRRYIAMVIAHELAHQWFGNLVTMEWWNDLWLNESFATLMEYLALDTLYPDWNIWMEYSQHEPVVALRRDSIDGVQAVQVAVNHPDEIHTLFDGAIVYAKGGRLLRMIQHYIGEEAFRAGLQQYFTDHAYKNTIGNDLWDALEAASGKKVKSIMNTWISQPGFPVVTLERKGGELTMSQQQFFVGPHEASNRKWPIPLDADDNNAPTLLEDVSFTYKTTQPVRLNLVDSAHFVTHYDDLSRDALISQIKSGKLDATGRMQLLNESTLLARGGVMRSEQLIPLVAAYQAETLEPVWNMLAGALAELRKFTEDDKSAETALRTLSARTAKREYERLGWEHVPGESEEDTKLRSTVIAMTLYGEVPEAIEKAKQLYESTPLEKLDPELRPLILSSVARYGDGTVVDALMAAHKATHSSELQTDICVGVTSTRVPEKIADLLENIKNPDIIRPQDVFRWFIYLVRGRESREQAWAWIQNNWDWVEKTFKSDKSYNDFPRYAASALTTRKQLAEYKAFFEPKKAEPSLTRTIDMGISEIEGRIELIERDKDSVIQTLLAQQ